MVIRTDISAQAQTRRDCRFGLQLAAAQLTSAAPQKTTLRKSRIPPPKADFTMEPYEGVGLLSRHGSV